MGKRALLFCFFTVTAVLMAYGPLKDLLSNPARSEYYSHILLIPLVSGYLIYRKKNNEGFLNGEYSLRKGFVVIVTGVALYGMGMMLQDRLNSNDFVAVISLSAVVFWIGGFLTIFGVTAFRIVKFPLFFLVFMIPIPTIVMDWIIHVLQAGSAEVTELLFALTGVPAFRSGFYFNLPGITIEVAKECSGIRSSLGLLITVVLAAHFFLKTSWKKWLLILAVLPVTIIKNGIRIVTLSILAIHIDMGFLTGGFLHRSGGFVFFLPALGLIGLLLYFLHKTEYAGTR